MKPTNAAATLQIGLLLGIVSVGSEAAPPEIDPITGFCKVSTRCRHGVNPACAQLYCRALRAGCGTKLSYLSGECKDIKDLWEAENCSTFAWGDCGKWLPNGLPVAGFLFEVGESSVAVSVDPKTIDSPASSGLFGDFLRRASKAFDEYQGNYENSCEEHYQSDEKNDNK
jgi:hypothetical protein